jgi:hypothetical protein
VLLHRGRRHVPLQVLDEGSDMKGLDAGQFGQAVGLAPGGKTAGDMKIGFADAVVVDLRGEEFEKAPGGFGVRGKQAGWLEFGSGGQGDCGQFHGFDDRV